jgi:hypothetical protein
MKRAISILTILPILKYGLMKSATADTIVKSLTKGLNEAAKALIFYRSAS